MSRGAIVADEDALQDLRRRLQAGGYSAPLGLDSVGLVRALLADLTEARTQRDAAQEQISQEESAKRHFLETAESLRRENADLAEANNELHGEMRRAGDVMDGVERDGAMAQSAARHARFQLSAALSQVRAQEADLSRLKAQFENLLQKSQLLHDQPVRAAIGQTIDIEKDAEFRPLPPMESVADSASPRQLLDAAQAKICALQADCDTLRATCDTLRALSATDRVLPSHKTPQNQSAEQIEFLTKEMIALEAQLQKYKAMEPLLAELRRQRDLMENEMREKEGKTKEMKEEMEAVRKMATGLQEEKARDLHAARNRAPRAVKELEKAQKTIARLEGELKRLGREKEDGDQERRQIQTIYQSYSSDKALLSSLVDEAEKRAAAAEASSDSRAEQLAAADSANAALQAKLESLTQDIAALHLQLDLHQQTIAQQQVDLGKGKDEKGKLAERIAALDHTIETLAADADTLAAQLAQVRNENSMLRDALQDQVTASVTDSADLHTVKRHAATIRSLQAERDEYRNETNRLSDLLSESGCARAQLDGELAREKELRHRAERELAEVVAGDEGLRGELAQRDLAILELRRQAQDLANDLADQRQQFQSLKMLYSSSGESLDKLREAAAASADLQRQVALQCHDLELHENQLQRLQQQLKTTVGHRDALAVVLREFDAHFVAVKIQVQNLVRERDDLHFRNSQLTAELDVRTHSVTDSETRRNQERQRLSQLQSDNAALAAVVKQFQEGAQANDGLLRQLRADLTDLQASKESLGRDLQQERRQHADAGGKNAALQSDLDASRRESQRMAKQIAALQNQLEAQRGTISSLRAEIDQLKSLVSQLESVQTSEAAEAGRVSAALQAARDEIAQRDAQLAAAESSLAAAHHDLDALRHAAQRLDSERDRLGHLLDERCEQLAELQERIAADDDAVAQSEERTKAALEELHGVRTELAEAQAALHHQEEILSGFVSDRQSLQAQIATKDAEIAALAEDLRNMTSENQFVNGELSLAVEERDGKAQEAFAALNKLLYLEELLNVQKREKEDLLGNYRLLCTENKRLIDTATELDGKCQGQLGELQRLHERCLRAEAARQETGDGQARLQIDLDQQQRTQERLTRSLQTLQEQLEASQRERESLVETIASTRSLSAGLESDREQLQRRLLLDQDTRNRLQQHIEQLEARIQAQTQQGERFQKRVVELEAALAEEKAGGGAVDGALAAQLQRVQHDNARLRQFLVEYERKLSSKETTTTAEDDDAAKDSLLSN